jgi:hypothetical protein
MVIDVLNYMTNMSNRKKGMRKGGSLRQNIRNRGNRSMITHPPSIDNFLLTHKTRLRFYNSANFNAAITFADLLDLIVMVTSATSASDVFHQVKVRAVEVWSLPSQGTATSCSVQFNNNVIGQVGDTAFHTDTSMGIEPAHVLARPNKGSLSGMFQSSSVNTAFTLQAPAGSVTDVLLTFRQQNATTQVAGSAVVAGTIGQIAWRSLDGNATASAAFTVPSNLYTV